jgi:hypothetical protein
MVSPTLISHVTATSILILYHLARKIVTTIQRTRGSAQPSNVENPATELPNTLSEGSQGTQAREVGALSRTVYFTHSVLHHLYKPTVFKANREPKLSLLVAV